MAVIRLKIEKLPAGISEKRLLELLSSKGKVTGIQMSRSSATVQMDSTSIQTTLMRSPTKTMGLISLLSMDSSGLGELKFTTVRLV